MAWNDVESQHGEVVPKPDQGRAESNETESRCQHQASSDRDVKHHDREKQRCDTEITDPVHRGAQPVQDRSHKETHRELVALHEVSSHEREGGG